MLKELIKVPLLISVSWGWHICSTSPRPPAAADEIVEGSVSGVHIARPMKLSLALSNGFEIIGILIQAAIPLLPAWIGFPSQGSQLGNITPVFFFGWVCVMTATAIRKKCYASLGRHFTFEISLQKDHRLVTTGPYSVVRHPGYAAGLMACSGVTLTLFDTLFFTSEPGISLDALNGIARQRSGVLAPVLLVLSLVKRLSFYFWLICAVSGVAVSARRTMVEDAVLEKEFGDEWRRWRDRVKYRIVPGVY